jgi:hypothetical protein
MELSGGALALRIVIGALAASMVFVVFYLVPSLIGSLASGISTGGGTGVSIQGMVDSLFPSTLPLIGILLTILTFVGVVVRGSRPYGAILILNGILFAAYFYILFQGGTISLTLPGGLPASASGTVSLGVSALMWIILVAPLLTIVKGLVILFVPAQPKAPAA